MNPKDESIAVSVALARACWMIAGPMALGLLAIGIVQAGTGWATALDISFFLVAAATLFAKWFELRSGQGQDSFGNPATIEQFPRYAKSFVPTIVAVWLVSNVLGNHLLK